MMFNQQANKILHVQRSYIGSASRIDNSFLHQFSRSLRVSIFQIQAFDLTIEIRQFSRHHIEGESSILIGALGDYGSLIRIQKVTIHPNYNPNPNSKNFVDFNLAVLQLECS